MVRRHFAAIAVVLALGLMVPSASAKPKLKVAPDGFPTGQNTPEGVASDLVRAFMQSDVALLQSICIRPYGDGQSRSDYSAHVASMVSSLQRQNERQSPPPDAPGRIAKVYAARHLTSEGPASYASATFDFRDVMFVDLQVELRNGKQTLQRTLVIKDHNNKWYVHPMPDVSPLLSHGLYDETPSDTLFSEVYKVEN